MKRNLVLIIILLIAGAAFASFSVTPTMGYGYVTGNRVFASDQTSYRKLAANGIEAGVVVGYNLSDVLRAEAYFDYLFALRGDMVNSSNLSTKPKQIDSNMKYTDYKAGLGVGYFIPINEKDSLRTSVGINFAGISNHYYSSTSVPKKIENEIDGNKVTSFGLYLELANHFHYSNKLDFVASVHGCYNIFGWIRTLDNHKWINHFIEKANIRLVSVFAQIGACYNL